MIRHTPPPTSRDEASAFDLLASSGLFDASFYADQARIPPNPDLCIRHYLDQQGGRLHQPSRFFDGLAYLALHGDVATAGTDPFIHFVRDGIREGREIRLPAETLRHLAAMSREDLDGCRLLNLNLGKTSNDDSRLGHAWSDLTIAVYASSLGSHANSDIADDICAALQFDGVRVWRLDQNSPRPESVDVELYVGPDEFFFLGGGRHYRDHRPFPRRILLNTADFGTLAHVRALTLVPSAALFLDVCAHATLLLRRSGIARSACFLPGWSGERSRGRARAVESLLNFMLPPNQSWPAADDAEWTERPLDVLFVGPLTATFSRKLAQLAPSLARYRCYINAPSHDNRELAGPRPLTFADACALARCAKILLDLSEDHVPCLSWSRVVQLGLQQGALVLAEPRFAPPGIDLGRHMLAATLDAMPATIDRLLLPSTGETPGRGICSHVRHELPPRFDLLAEVRALARLDRTTIERACLTS